MDERAKELIRNLVELMRSSQQRVYDYEFADYLMCNTGIKPEELVECGIYGSRPQNFPCIEPSLLESPLIFSDFILIVSLAICRNFVSSSFSSTVSFVFSKC